MCVRPWAIKTIHVKLSLNNQSNKSYCFQFLCNALAIDTIDGQGLSNEVRYELLPKKSKVTLCLLFITR